MSDQSLSDATSEGRFRALADEAPVMIFLAESDPVGGRTFFNAKWTDFVGMTEAQIAGSGWLNALHQGDREDVARIISDAAAGHKPYTVEYRVKRSDGELRWLVERASPRESGGYAGTAADITEGRASRESLAASERRFRALVENSTDVVWLVDERGAINYASPSTQSVLDWQVAPETIFDPELADGADLLALQDAFAIAKTRAGVSPLHLTRIHDGSGAWRDVEVIFNNCLEDPAIHGVVVTLRDVTEQRQSRETIERLRSALTSAQDDERRELAMALHDDTIQAILSAQWTLTSLSRVVSSESNASNQLEDVSVMLEAAAASARAVLGDLRVPDFEEVDLQDALEELVRSHHEAGGPACELTVSGAELLDPIASRVVYRIVREGLNNVRKHSQASIASVGVEANGTRAEVVVADNGVGVDPQLVVQREKEGHFGIVSLREQVAQFGGSLSLERQESGGSSLVAVMFLT